MAAEQAGARAVAHFFVADLEQPEMDEADRHHAERVLRLRTGETVTVSDGHGGLRRCTLAAGRLEPAGDVERFPAPTPMVAVGFALVKGGRPEWIVQKLTECGVDRIVPFVAARSVVRWDDAAKSDRHAERLARVARGAAMQSRQVRLPVVDRVASFDAVVASAAVNVALAHLDGARPTASGGLVLVGPEGGWAPEERTAVPELMGFGASVLRAETAAVAAAVLLTALRAGVVGPLP